MQSTRAELKICTDARLLHLGALRDQAPASWKRLVEGDLRRLPGAFIGVDITACFPRQTLQVRRLQSKAQPRCVINPALVT